MSKCSGPMLWMSASNLEHDMEDEMFSLPLLSLAFGVGGQPRSNFLVHAPGIISENAELLGGLMPRAWAIIHLTTIPGSSAHPLP